MLANRSDLYTRIEQQSASKRPRLEQGSERGASWGSGGKSRSSGGGGGGQAQLRAPVPAQLRLPAGGRPTFSRAEPGSQRDEAKRPTRTRQQLLPVRSGEVRFDSPDDAATALEVLQGSIVRDCQITISQMDSRDGCKLQVEGLDEVITWQDLKDHFKQLGPVAFAAINGDNKRPPGAGAGPGPPRHNEVASSPLPLGHGPVGEIRYADPGTAQLAVRRLSGSLFHGAPITVAPDPASTDGTKLKVFGLPIGTQWQELKDHFAALGHVVFSNVLHVMHQDKGNAGGKKGGGGGGAAGASGSKTYSQAQMPQSAIVGGSMLGGYGWGRSNGESQVPGGVRLMQHAVVPTSARSHAAPSSGGGGGGAGASQRKTTCMAEIRYQRQDDAFRALKEMNGEYVDGHQVFVQVDGTSSDGTKLLISGVPTSIDWKALKDIFGRIGPVAFAQVLGGGGPGPGASSSGSGGGGGGNARRATSPPMMSRPARPSSSTRGGTQQMAMPMGMPLQGNPMPMTFTSISGGMPVTYIAMPMPAGAMPTSAPHVQTSAPHHRTSGSKRRASTSSEGPVAGTKTGEVRYEGPNAPACVQEAVQHFNGATVKGRTLAVDVDRSSPDGSKLLVRNLDPSIQWQELKDMFKVFGKVAFATVVQSI